MDNYSELVAAQTDDRSITNSCPITEPISMCSLLDRLGEQKPDFLDRIQHAIHIYVASQGRRLCMSIVETDGLGDGHPRTHILNSDSLSENATYADVFQCFIRKKRYHDHALDSGLSEPVAGIIAREYGTVVESKTEDLKQYFLGRLIEDEVVRKSLAVHIATLLAKKGVKTARDELTHLITQAIAQHASAHTNLAVQHGVTVTAQHTAVVTAGTSAGAVVASIVGAILIKVFASHIAVILPKIISSEAFHVLIAAATHKIVLVSTTAATANLLAAKAGAASASAFLHAIIGPVAIIYVVYKLNRLPNELGESIAKSVKRELDETFRSITEQVLKEMGRDICNLEELAKAFVDDVITVDGWEKHFDGLDVTNPAIIDLNHEIASGVGYVKDFQKLAKADEMLDVPGESSSAYQAVIVCPTCSLDLGPLDEFERLRHANACLDQSYEREHTVNRV